VEEKLLRVPNYVTKLEAVPVTRLEKGDKRAGKGENKIVACRGFKCDSLGLRPQGHCTAKPAASERLPRSMILEGESRTDPVTS
jgi:hypothetical protein